MFAGVFAIFGIASAQGGIDPGMNLNQRPIAKRQFVENKGQWDSRALFRYSIPGMDYWVTGDGIKVDLYNVHRIAASGGPTPTSAVDVQQVRTGHVVHFKFLGAGATSEPWGYAASDVTTDFFVGPTSKHARNVRSFGEAYIKSIYPGTHVRNYLFGEYPRYDVVVEAGFDPNNIVFDVIGADKVTVDADGDLVVDMVVGELRHRGLFVYQPVGNARMIVDARFRMLDGNTVKIDVGDYDPRLPVIIDPLVYGTYLGSDDIPFVSSGYEQVFGIQADDEGNLFVTGETSSISFPVTDGPYEFSLNGAMDSFLIRLEADSYDTSYVAYLGGSGSDTGFSIAFDRVTGDLWIAGRTDSADFPGTSGSGTSLTGVDDVFLSKFSVNATGSITPVGSRYYSAPGDGVVEIDMVLSNAGDMFVTGQNSGLAFTPYLAGAGGGDDGFVTKFDSAGAMIWERQYGSNVDDVIGQLDVDTVGNVVVTGAFFKAGTEDTATAATPTFVTTAGVYPEGRIMRNGDIFIVKLDGAGTTVFASLLGGSESEASYAVTTDFENNIYVAGQTASFDYPRNQGAYSEAPKDELTATKISSDGTALLYSTGLRTTGPLWINAIDVDDRGILTLGGVVSWRINPASTLTSAQPALPATITVVNPLDGLYVDGDNATFSNGAPALHPPTNDGFVIFLNSAGNDVLFADYMGMETDDYVNDVFVDSVGATWLGGFTQAVICIDGSLKPGPLGLAPWLTANAFKLDMGETGDGWLVKMRVDLPIVAGIILDPKNVAGGLGVTSTATVFLREPAPTGGVTVTAVLSNADATSFTEEAGSTQVNLFIAEGTISTTVVIHSLPVTSQTFSNFRVLLDNDFVEERLTVKPWLDDFSISPATIVGGNQLTARINLFQNAVQNTTVTLTTSRSDIVDLPSPPQVTVPTGARTVTVLLDTMGVTTSQNLSVSGSLLGVTKIAPATLTPAALQTFSFNPPRVNGGSDSTGTITMNGKAGVNRTLTISHVAGVAGSLVNGSTLPTTVTLPAQADKVSFSVTAPFVATSDFETMSASDGTTTATGTLFIDDIDIFKLNLGPPTDLISGTVLTGNVELTRTAGPGGFTVDISNSNVLAGTLSDTTITVLEGSLVSPDITFTAEVVSAVQITTLTASKTGFTSQAVDITVNPITMDLTLNPAVAAGGVDTPVGTVTLNSPAPSTGLSITLSSTDSSVASVPATVDILGGATSATFDIMTFVTPVDRVVSISAVASTAVQDSETLVVLTPGIVSIVVDPSTVTGPDTSIGTVTLSAAAPAGGLAVAIVGTPSSVVILPSVVTVDEGETSVSFNIGTTAVNNDTDVTITASIGSSVNSTTLTVRSPIVAGITFSPPRIIGGGIAVGTIILDQPAPAGGTTVNVASDDAVLAFIIGPSTILIPAGSRTATFDVQTRRVVRIIAVRFTGGPAGSPQVATGFLYIKP